MLYNLQSSWLTSSPERHCGVVRRRCWDDPRIEMSGVIQRCQLIAKSSLRRRRILAAAAAAAVVVIHGTATRADRGDKHCFANSF